MATAADVHDKLASYHVNSEVRATGGTIETYAIQKSAFPSWPLWAVFTFDRQGVLEEVQFDD